MLSPMSEETSKYHFVASDPAKLIKSIGKTNLIKSLKEMLLIRNFETRAEAAYQQGHIGGFFHSYIGQEAIQTAAVNVIGLESWWTTTYRCHALALLNGEPPKEIMAELYGKVTGNAKGRGGSMHLYSSKLLGGFGIVGGGVPVAVGAAFSLKYLKESGRVSTCFIGDGAFVQGAVHESLNLASLWNLPFILVIENNQWGMGTAVSRAICHQPIAESFGPAYNIKTLTLDGMDYFSCYAGFKEAFEEVARTSRPCLIEAVSERFKGHSVSDPGLYRSKEELECAMKKDPITHFTAELIKHKVVTQEEVDSYNQEQKEIVLEAMQFADKSPLPDLTTLEEDVLI
jgi:pyruvate dehydrogenase E1 component alpha subunit